jgi:hypothetical protein
MGGWLGGTYPVDLDVFAAGATAESVGVVVTKAVLVTMFPLDWVVMMVLEVCTLDAVVDDAVEVDEEDEELLLVLDDEVVVVGEEVEEAARVVVAGAAEVAAVVELALEVADSEVEVVPIEGLYKMDELKERKKECYEAIRTHRITDWLVTGVFGL